MRSSFSGLAALAVTACATFVACSSDSARPGADEPGAGCERELPEVLTVSEGGRLVLERSGALAEAGATFEGRGVSLTVEDAQVTLRAPYLAEADEALAVDVTCGGGAPVSVPVELRPLTWTRLAEWPEDPGPPAREYGAWWLDSGGDGALYVFGGFHYRPAQFTPANDAWRFDFGSNAWSPVAGDLPLLPGGRAAPIPGARAVYYFGGSEPTDNGSLSTPPSMFRFDYDESAITPREVEPLGDVGGSYTGSLMYDPKRERWLSVCGVDTATGLHCRVHAFAPDGGFAVVRTDGKAPRGRYGFHYAYDEETDRVVVFGGQDGSGNEAIAGDTWALELGREPPAWVQLSASDPAASKRRNGAFAFDPVGHRLFVWGGTPDGRNSVKGLQALSFERGAEAWTDITTTSGPPSRTSALAIYDAPRARIVVGFGNDDAVYRDLWALDLGNGDVP
jgi:hypothetical protein